MARNNIVGHREDLREALRHVKPGSYTTSHIEAKPQPTQPKPVQLPDFSKYGFTFRDIQDPNLTPYVPYIKVIYRSLEAGNGNRTFHLLYELDKKIRHETGSGTEVRGILDGLVGDVTNYLIGKGYKEPKSTKAHQGPSLEITIEKETAQTLSESERLQQAGEVIKPQIKDILTIMKNMGYTGLKFYDRKELVEGIIQGQLRTYNDILVKVYDAIENAGRGNDAAMALADSELGKLEETILGLGRFFEKETKDVIAFQVLYELDQRLQRTGYKRKRRSSVYKNLKPEEWLGIYPIFGREPEIAEQALIEIAERKAGVYVEEKKTRKGNGNGKDHTEEDPILLLNDEISDIPDDDFEFIPPIEASGQIVPKKRPQRLKLQTQPQKN